MAYYVSLRVKDLPNPYAPSLKGICKKCGEEVWCSRYVNENDRLIREIINQGNILCVECATAKVENLH